MAKAKAVKSTAKTKATKGDSTKPLKSTAVATETRPVESNERKPYELKVELPKISRLEAEAVAVEMLRDAYVETVKYFMKRRDEEESNPQEIETIEGLLKSFERVITWFDQSPMWLEDLHSGNLPKKNKKSA